MERIDLTFREQVRRCEVFIGSGLLVFMVEDLRERPLGKRLGIMTDTRVKGLWGDRLCEILNASGLRTDLFSIMSGEQSKQWETVQTLINDLAEKGFDRTSALIALGGGVVGDVVGFVASLYMRSIPYAQVPTTLLAQVDSSLGGKNGIDLARGKNLVGTFYQPHRIYIDPSILVTLPDDEFRNGLAEVIKSAVVGDADFFGFLEDSHDAVSERHPQALEETVLSCCRIKSRVVMEDERESNSRRILNFGHTVGHAIETHTQYLISHGMAVSIGMAVEASLSTRMGMLHPRDRQRILDLLERYDLPTRIPKGCDPETLLELMRSDKKAEEGRIAVVLPRHVGDVIVAQAVPTEAIWEALKEAQA